ncbi:MAG: ferredoxin [Candidatus Methanomethylicota archaeon]|nr:ferredoxin family protein [Candidatus Culexmicrobium cathedralense]RLE48960.1 MAG: ferredoxin [Candidatus Verstraetearchaeota archaeon]
MPTIIVNSKYCKGCGICVEMCPAKVFELSKEINEKGYHQAIPVKQDKCTLCHLCELYCPDQAITIIGEGEIERGGAKATR